MNRSGAALLELLTALSLLAILGAASASLIRSQAVLARNVSERIAVHESFRTAQHVLAAELRELMPADLRAISSDSVAARVFRGWGIVCGTRDQSASLRYKGIRSPEPAKDSLLLVADDRTTAFTDGQTNPGCRPREDEEIVAVRTQPPLALGALVLVFESGAYHLVNNALRYRRSSEGRQPITDELIDHRASRFIFDSSRLELKLRSVKSVVTPAESAVFSIGFLNRRR